MPQEAQDVKKWSRQVPVSAVGVFINQIFLLGLLPRGGQEESIQYGYCQGQAGQQAQWGQQLL